MLLGIGISERQLGRRESLAMEHVILLYRALELD
jgi:hypothetical protein